jgi:hypothetical protein
MNVITNIFTVEGSDRSTASCPYSPELVEGVSLEVHPNYEEAQDLLKSVTPALVAHPLVSRSAR